MEKDDEFTNSTSHLDFGARIYDSRIGRWMSIDAELKKAPSRSSYRAFFCTPLKYTDPDGDFELEASVLENENYAFMVSFF